MHRAHIRLLSPLMQELRLGQLEADRMALAEQVGKLHNLWPTQVLT